MAFRTGLFWLHLAAGVAAGVVILVMSVTGVLLTYERQVVAWSDRDLRSVPPPAGGSRASIEVVVREFKSRNPELAPAIVTRGVEVDAPLVVLAPPRTIYLDAYSGRVLGEGNGRTRRLMVEIRAWHRWLAAEGDGRPLGRAVTGWANVVFLFIVISGLYLWVPRAWAWPHVKAVLIFRRGHATGRARDFNWHNAIGIWSAVPLFIVVFTAVPISFPWASALVYRAVGEEPPVRGGRGEGGRGGAVAGRGTSVGTDGRGSRVAGTLGRAESAPPIAPPAELRDSYAGLDALWARAETHVPSWRTISLRLPTGEQDPVVFSIDRGDGGQPQLRSALTLGRDGQVVRAEGFGDSSRGQQLRSLMRFAHTGEVLGLVGQTIAGLASAGAVVMVWTGLALTWRRFSAWRARQHREDRQSEAA